MQLNKKCDSKPFHFAIVKFSSVAQLQLALSTHRSFGLRDGRQARMLPYDPTLTKSVKSSQVLNQKLYDPNDFDYKVLIKPQTGGTDEVAKSMEPTPDNATAVVNLFLKGLDKSWTV